ALSLPVKKDKEGHALMLRVCRPRTTEPLVWWEDETRMGRMSEYCGKDVEAEHLLDKKLPPLSEIELRVWHATERLNDQGLGVDPLLLEQVLQLAEEARIDLDSRIKLATHGLVPRVCDHGALTRWLATRGIETESVDRQAVKDLLDRDDLDDDVRDVLEMRQV